MQDIFTYSKSLEANISLIQASCTGKYAYSYVTMKNILKKTEQCFVGI